MTYAGFWRRFGAFWVDFIVMLPIMAISYYGSQYSRLFQWYFLLPSTLFGLWFSVYLVLRYGGTPGKLVLRTKIVMSDGSPVTLKAAILRHSVLFILSLAGTIGICIASLRMSDSTYDSLGFMQRAVELVALAPSWYNTANIALQIWIWSEFVTVLFNKKRRAIHDFIAGTAVIKTA